MGAEKEEVQFELLERIEDAYRLPTSFQMTLFMILEIIIISILYALHVALDVAVIVFLLATSFLYPYAIKVRTLLTELAGMVIFGCTIAAVVYYLVVNVEIGGSDFWMLVIFVLVFGVELLHHIYEKAKTIKSPTMIVADLVLTVVFALALWMFLSGIGFDPVWTIILTALLSGLYFYAIFPEKPY